MSEQQPFGFQSFIGQTDAVGMFLFLVLLVMSVASWTVIMNKTRLVVGLCRAEAGLLGEFAGLQNLDGLRTWANQSSTALNRDILGIVQASLSAAQWAQLDRVGALISVESPSELLSRSLQQAIDEASSAMESGQTLLASVASSAPFVGLFGTVLGIYHALLSIGASGQSSLDQVAGPVGEALIMTALGLAVAIPAALAYNAFQRQTRLRLARLERLAHRLFVFVSTGLPPRGL